MERAKPTIGGLEGAVESLVDRMREDRERARLAVLRFELEAERERTRVRRRFERFVEDYLMDEAKANA